MLRLHHVTALGGPTLRPHDEPRSFCVRSRATAYCQWPQTLWCQLAEHTLHIAIRNEVADLPVLSDALEAFCVRHGVAGTPRAHLQVVLDELVSNIIKYAWPDGGAHRIEFFVSALTEGIRLELVDDGQPFDPRSVKAPPQRTPGSRPQIGGLGLHLVRQLVDRIDYVRSSGCNHTIVKKECAVRISPGGAVDA